MEYATISQAITSNVNKTKLDKIQNAIVGAMKTTLVKKM